MNNKDDEKITLLRSFMRQEKEYEILSNSSLGRNNVFFLHNRTYVLKIFYRKDKWYNEKSALEYLTSIDAKVYIPHVLESGIYKEKLYWLKISNIPGITAELYLKTNMLENPYQLYESIGKLHAHLHNTCNTSYFGAWSELKNNFIEYSDYITNKNENIYLELLSLERPDIGILKESYKKLLELEGKLGKVNCFTLCHNDFNPRNILVQKEENDISLVSIVGLIDFESSFFGEKEFDMVGMIFHVKNKEEWKCYISGYRKSCLIGEIDKNKFIYYLIALCLRICVWSYDVAYDYYNKSVIVLTKILNQEMEYFDEL